MAIRRLFVHVGSGLALAALAATGAAYAADVPVALSLKVLPADLTQLAKQNGGQFPYVRVRAVIDGRGVLGPHGPAEMPVWGERFRQEGMTSLEVRGRILNIVDYLSAIQEP